MNRYFSINRGTWGEKMAELAIIASQNVETSAWLADPRSIRLTADGTSVPAVIGSVHGQEVIVILRNSSGRPVAPHGIDYRANIEALARAGVRKVLTTAMVGSLRPSIPNGSMLILDQFIDFTRGRQVTYFTGSRFAHADMTEPYCPVLREQLIRSAGNLGLAVAPQGCYVCVPGPRFETRAEVRMFGQLGGDVVGFTSVTECVMAREAGMCFATFAGVVNLAAGLFDGDMKTEDWRGVRKLQAVRFTEIVTELVRSSALDSAGARSGCGCATAAPIES